MGKRKRSRSKDSDYDSILRKVKKLASKLRKRRRLSSSASEESGRHSVRYYDEYEPYADMPGDDIANEVYDDSLLDPAEPIAGPSTLLSVTAPNTVPIAEPAASAQAGPSVTITEGAQATPTADQNILTLDPDILQLLGEDPTNQRNYGDSLHKDIASRWTHILVNGLSKETQMELMKCYLPPENCPSMKAPKLNLEIKAALKQNQLASSLSAKGRALNWALLSNNTVPQDIINPSRTIRPPGPLQRISLSRRYAALTTLNKSIKDTVKNTNIDEHLFGSALSEHIKTSKAINKTGFEIKQKIQRPQYRTLPAIQSRGALNSRGAPPRVTAAVESRPTPAPRRPPRDRRQEAPRGRRPTGDARHQTRRR
ncbi:hypothetical protein ABMA27_002769 [Loxostege sticticalis]|uniref:Uncharacterized protein n=1 Tax=Loxostege sticticalis TaxID=481309 RepID=A0ABR3HUS4_LOXSC